MRKACLLDTLGLVTNRKITKKNYRNFYKSLISLNISNKSSILTKGVDKFYLKFQAEAARNGITADATPSPSSSVSEGLDMFPDSPLHRSVIGAFYLKELKK